VARFPSSYADLVTAKRIQLYTNTAAVPLDESLDPSATIPAVSSNGAGADELISVTDMRYSHDRPETRTNIAQQRIYTHGAPDIQLPILCEGNTDMLQFFEERIRDDATSLELAVYTWLFRVTNALGEQVDFRFRGKLTNFAVEKARGEQAEFVARDGRDPRHRRESRRGRRGYAHARVRVSVRGSPCAHPPLFGGHKPDHCDHVRHIAVPLRLVHH